MPFPETAEAMTSAKGPHLRTFFTAVDGSTNAALQYVQGERVHPCDPGERDPALHRSGSWL
jgi:hypothetical protein